MQPGSWVRNVEFNAPKHDRDQNKAVVYDILFKAASGTLLTITAIPSACAPGSPFTAILHAWSSALTGHAGQAAFQQIMPQPALFDSGGTENHNRLRRFNSFSNDPL